RLWCSYLAPSKIQRSWDSRIVAFVRMADRPPQTIVELAAVQDHLVGVNGSNGIERNGEIAGVLHIDDKLRAAVRRNFADGAERLISVMHENVETFADRLVLHLLFRWHGLPQNAGRRASIQVLISAITVSLPRS